jgi:uncharacterized protein (DUF1015 family)
VASVISNKPMFVADGHHRYETACNYRDELAANSELDPTHPANGVMTMCVSMDDPGMIVLPTHRLFKGLPTLTSDQLRDRLSGSFELEAVPGGPDAAAQIWAEIELEDDQGRIGLRTQTDGKWIVAKLTDDGRAKMAEVASEHSEDWQGLGVSILQRLIMETLLDAHDLPKPTYVHLIEEVVDALDSTPNDYPLAALVMPATLDHIRAISEHGERMPAKSTYFYPKLLSGLVINPLR